MRLYSSLKLVCTLVVFFAGLPSLLSQEVAFGGIELASSSVKGLTFTFEPGTESNVPGAARSDRMKRLQYAERNASFISMRDGCKLSDRGMDLLVKDTSEVVTELREGAKAKNLGSIQLFAVGSSGLGAVCNTDEIVSKVQAATGLCAEFITASDEAKYSLGFVLPRDRYRSLILDISGGNTLGGYYVTTKGGSWPPTEWHGFEIKYGARNLKDKALALVKKPRTDAQGNPLPALTFYQAVDQVLEDEVGPALDELKEANSGLDNFQQVYMVGGVVWATSTRMRPTQQEEYAINSITTADFDNVLLKIKDGSFNTYSGSEFAPKTSQKTKDDAGVELTDVLQRFDMQSLYAGISLARYIVVHTTPGAHLYFPTTAAWISGYARQKFREAGRTVPTCTAATEVRKGN
jgi:Ppx/GppA phosphatase family